jgi:hypothetical protein
VIYGDTRSQARASPRRRWRPSCARGPTSWCTPATSSKTAATRRDWQEFFDHRGPAAAPRRPSCRSSATTRSCGPCSSASNNYRRYVHVAPDGPIARARLRASATATPASCSPTAYDDWTGDRPATGSTGELARARREGPDDWLFVVMHWGPRSSGPHGDNELLAQAGIDALLRRHRVDLVIAGPRPRSTSAATTTACATSSPAAAARRCTDGAAQRGCPAPSPRSTTTCASTWSASKVTLHRRAPRRHQIDRATLRHEGWEDLRPAAPPPAPTPAPAPAPAAPEGPPDNTLWKALPLAALVALGGWWLRRRG